MTSKNVRSFVEKSCTIFLPVVLIFDSRSMVAPLIGNSKQILSQYGIRYQHILPQINGRPYSGYTNKSSINDGGDRKGKKNKKYRVEKTREELIKQYHEKILASKTFQQAKLERNQSDIHLDMFLLPFLYYNMGPNNLFR